MRFILFFLLLATVSNGQDLEADALAFLTGREVGPNNCFIAGGNGVRSGTTAGLTMEQVRAATNTPAFATWQMERLANTEPDPAVLVPGLTTNGLPDGSEWRVVVIDGEVYATKDHGSPKRAWKDQVADLKANASKRKNRIATLKSEIAAASTIGQLKAALLKWANAQ